MTLAAVFNLLGALAGTAVATTIAAGLVDRNFVNLTTILFALLSAILWNLITWWFGLPSSWDPLIGGLCGSALAAGGGELARDQVGGHRSGHAQDERVALQGRGADDRLAVAGCVGGFAFMGLMIVLFRGMNTTTLHKVFGKAQVGSAAWISFSHGLNDAQKTMGIIALTLFTGYESGALDDLPMMLAFLRHAEVRNPHLGQGDLCAGDGSRQHVRGLADYQNDGVEVGSAANHSWVCRADHRRRGHQYRQFMGDAAFDHPRHFHLDHGRGGNQTPERDPLAHDGPHRGRLDPHPATHNGRGLRPDVGMRADEMTLDPRRQEFKTQDEEG